MNTERRGQPTQKGRAGAKPRQGPTWTLHLHCCLGRPGQTLRGPVWPEGLGKPGSGQVSIQSWGGGGASILHCSYELGKSMHLPQGAGGDTLPNAAALLLFLPCLCVLRVHASLVHPPTAGVTFSFFRVCISSQSQQTRGNLAVDIVALSRLCCSAISLVKDFTTYSPQTSSWSDRPRTSPFAPVPPISFIKCHLGRTSCPLSSEPLKAGTHTCSACNMTRSSTKQLAQRHVGDF